MSQIQQKYIFEDAEAAVCRRQLRSAHKSQMLNFQEICKLIQYHMDSLKVAIIYTLEMCNVCLQKAGC